TTLPLPALITPHETNDCEPRHPSRGAKVAVPALHRHLCSTPDRLLLRADHRHGHHLRPHVPGPNRRQRLQKVRKHFPRPGNRVRRHLHCHRDSLRYARHLFPHPAARWSSLPAHYMLTSDFLTLTYVVGMCLALMTALFYPDGLVMTGRGWAYLGLYGVIVLLWSLMATSLAVITRSVAAAVAAPITWMLLIEQLMVQIPMLEK